MKKTSFSQRLSLALSDAGMSAADLGRECDLSKSTISQYRSGKYEAKYDRIVKMARVLGCSPEWLSGQDVPMTPVVSDSTMGTVPVLAMSGLNPEALFASENICGQEPAEELYCDGHHFVLIAEDDSMDPLILCGDKVLCVRQDTLADGQTGILILPDGSVLIRRIASEEGERVMERANRYYPPRHIDDSIRIAGRVVRTTRIW